MTNQDCTGNGEFCNVALYNSRCECANPFVEVDWRCLPGIFLRLQLKNVKDIFALFQIDFPPYNFQSEYNRFVNYLLD